MSKLGHNMKKWDKTVPPAMPHQTILLKKMQSTQIPYF